MQGNGYARLQILTQTETMKQKTRQGRLSIVKMSVLLTLMYTSSPFSIKIRNPSKLFCRYQQTDSKFYLERQKTCNNQHNFKEVARPKLPYFKITIKLQ